MANNIQNIPSRNVSLSTIIQKERVLGSDFGSIQDSSIVNIETNQKNMNFSEQPRLNGLISVNRFVSNRKLEKNSSIKSIVLPPI